MTPWMISTIVLYILGGFLFALHQRDTQPVCVRSYGIDWSIVLMWPLMIIFWLLLFCFSKDFRNG